MAMIFEFDNVKLTVTESVLEKSVFTNGKGRGELCGSVDDLKYVREQAEGKKYIAVENDDCVFEIANIVWTDSIWGHHSSTVSMIIEWDKESHTTKNMMTQSDKDLFFIKRNTKIVSEPGACLTVSTTAMPPRIQKRISDALKGKPSFWDNIADRFFKRT